MMLSLLRLSASQTGRLATQRAPMPSLTSASGLASNAMKHPRSGRPLAYAMSTRSDSSGPEEESRGNASSAPGAPRIVVFGGNGYVGSHVCQAALAAGLDVTSVSRSGRPGFPTGMWGEEVSWVAGDALDPESYAGVLDGAAGVVCCIGGFGSNEQMLKVNGDTNMQALRAASAASVPRAAFISVHDYKLPEFVLAGYFRGKRNVEDVLRELFPESGVILRPGFIHGTRMVGNTAVPLGYVGEPLEKLLKMLPSKSMASIPLAGAAAVPPVSVEKVAKVSVTAVSDPSFPAGILDPWQLQEF